MKNKITASKQASKQASRNNRFRKQCQDIVFREYEKSESRICRECLSSRWDKSNIESKRLQRTYSDIVCLGFIEKGTGKHQSNSVYSKEGLSPTLCAGLGVKQTGIFIVVEDGGDI